MVDRDGMFANPGDAFKTADAAAADFARLYNDNSIKDNREFATIIYKVETGSTTYYTYTPPKEGGLSGSQPKDAGSGLAYEDVATAHTHGAYSNGAYDDNHFSPADVTYANVTGIPDYVATPNGSLQKVDPSGNITQVPGVNNIPSDPKDPTRTNNINPANLPKNEPTYSFGDWIMFKIVLPLLGGAKEANKAR